MEAIVDNSVEQIMDDYDDPRTFIEVLEEGTLNEIKNMFKMIWGDDFAEKTQYSHWFLILTKNKNIEALEFLNSTIPEHWVFQYDTIDNIFKASMKYAIQSGQLDLTKYFIKHVYNIHNDNIWYYTIKGNQMNIFKYLLKKLNWHKLNDDDQLHFGKIIFNIVIYHDQYSMFKYFVDEYEPRFEFIYAFCHAIEGGNMKILHYLHSCGFNYKDHVSEWEDNLLAFNNGLPCVIAYREGHINAIKMMIKIGIPDFELGKLLAKSVIREDNSITQSLLKLINNKIIYGDAIRCISVLDFTKYDEKILTCKIMRFMKLKNNNELKFILQHIHQIDFGIIIDKNDINLVDAILLAIELNYHVFYQDFIKEVNEEERDIILDALTNNIYVRQFMENYEKDFLNIIRKYVRLETYCKEHLDEYQHYQYVNQVTSEYECEH